MATIQDISVENLEAIRSSQPLHNHLPKTYPTMEEADRRCIELFEGGVLKIVGITYPRDRREITEKMILLRGNQSLSRDKFRMHTDELHKKLVVASVNELRSSREADLRAVPMSETVKAAFSVRAGLAFLQEFLTLTNGIELGFITQERVESGDSVETHSLAGKLGSFAGKDAIIFDPMLATGGSMYDAMDSVAERGARDIYVVSSFATPHGVSAISEHPKLKKIFTLPLEAGLNEHAFIVGGIGAGAMLGDFGDRYFGPAE